MGDIIIEKRYGIYTDNPEGVALSLLIVKQLL